MIECKLADGLLVVSPSGKLDSGNTQAFEESLLAQMDAPVRGVLFDFSQLDYISSAGLRVILRTLKQFQTQGLRFMLAGLNPLVREIFEIAGFLAFFEVYDTVGEALKSGV